ncbi:histidine--tRNA ligase [Intestinibacter bartlettii]|uniref:histidine--tRNA ligase n=3 Tax=Intestinibacter bartlettii TaxID=261299 RepID=UPI001D021490|nr:histidine--tRNA ligase [Intestinibacter bartlettii]MDU1253998.1 histidine--tRNA ligase [Peptostreptococcaceae bacterium]MCB5746385.1 histidine--tRNA ligase [Intestinibacter bartlettii]MDU2692958.1 histidine--tRNA ligase [Intestinibacter bartlettii]MDU4257869.1 histidine--tRNA ligase [Intestinibacter bartlettii]MDU6199026.1 histidine--tRNA ligase [Intestinibacter bartlettii]
MLSKAPRGTKDITPKDVYKWHYVEKKFREICALYGYEEIRTPIFEHTEVFARSVGDTTDVVQKEMYSFTDRGDRQLSLKPEGTAGVIRSFIENKMYADTQPTKLYYITPCFRYERPQAGRQRQFHQFGIEVLGSDGPSVDAEVISLAVQFFNEMGLKNLSVNINSVGCPTCREEYNRKLKEYLDKKVDVLCETCLERKDKNPMRVIDCKNPHCKENLQDIPFMIDHLCDDCKEHFEKLQTYLKEMDINYVVDKTIVRGLDYYKKTAFEIISNDIGSQSTVCGGGRYDGLVEMLGGPKGISGIGFGLGVERLLLTLENNNIEIENPKSTDIYIATIGDAAKTKSFKLIKDLRSNHISADNDHLDKSLKAQFKYSDKLNAKYTVVIGDDELANDTATLKNMKTSEQTTIKLSELVDELKKRL